MTVSWPSWDSTSQSYAHFDDVTEIIKGRLLPARTSLFVNILPELGRLYGLESTEQPNSCDKECDGELD